MIRFNFLTGDVNWIEYGGKWVSTKLNNGDFDYWLVLELTNMDDACGRDNKGQPKYHVCLSAVSPDQVSQENIDKAMESCGPGGDFGFNPILQVEALHSYGISAPIKQWSGNNAMKLLKEARKEAQFGGSMLFGFAMDAAKNAIGTTGWELLRGDMDSGLARTISSGSPTGRILAKMHGINPDSMPLQPAADVQQPKKGKS